MGATKSKIKLTILESGIIHNFETYPRAYRNLMSLIKDNFYPDNFGECGGLGRCATCIIKTEGITGNSKFKTRNEPATLEKMNINDEAIRLSCQLTITNDLNDAVIEIIDLDTV